MKKIFKFTIALLILVISFNIKTYAATEVYGENVGYGYVEVTYHSNYVGNHANEEYTIKHPIAIDSEGKKYITAGEDKFDEILVNKKNTGFRGYTLTNNNSGSFWNESLSEKIYLQGYKIYLSDLGLTEQTTEETQYTANMYAQWQQATVIYVYNASVTTSVLKTYNSNSAYNPLYESYNANDQSTWYFTTSNVVNGLTNAYSKLSTSGTIHTQYVVFLKSASISGTLTAKQATWTGKYNGLTYLSPSSGYLTMETKTILKAPLRIRNIKLYNANIGRIQGNIYAAGYSVYIDYGVENHSGNVSYSSYELGSCCIAVLEEYVSGSSAVPSKQEVLVLSGHWVRVSGSEYESLSNLTFGITIGGKAQVDFFCAGNGDTVFSNNTVKIEARDQARINGMYGGHHGYNSMKEWTGKVTLNVEGNAYVHEIYGTGGGRFKNSSPIFKGTSTINVMSGTVDNLFGGPSAGRVQAPSSGTSEIYINIKGGKIGNVYGGGHGYTYDPVYPLTYIHNYSGSVTGNIYITVGNAVIENLYGGGKGFNFYYDIDGNGTKDNLKTTSLASTQLGFKLSLSEAGNAWHKGNTTIILNSGTVINGNVYGAGEGYDDATHVETARKDSGCVKILINEGALINGNVYGGGNNSYVKDSSVANVVDLEINGGFIKGNVYGGGNNANITGNVIIHNNDSNIKTIYGGGNNGNITGNCKVEIISGEFETIYGGGNNGDVTGNCNMEIVSGKFKTVYGGGNLGTVKGNVTLLVGDEREEYIQISEVLYGGGKGNDANDETVTGTANVLIKGINTYIANYGSVKLGKVTGNVNVTFENYWTGNTTNKYKIMNGIDRATNVYFNNAYVLLENKDENGSLTGIKDITNLHIPENSGLKISANSTLLGDFYGGGTLCLDSGLNLTINGNMHGETILVLIPMLTEHGGYIKGGKEFPYIKILGVDEVEGKAAYSKNPEYIVLRDKEQSGNIIYYIDEVYITEMIKSMIKNAPGKHYRDDVNSWSDENVYIINSGIFSTDCNIEITFNEDKNLGDIYKNITRTLELYTGDNVVSLPVGTNIVMLNNDRLYKYRVLTDTSKIRLNEFVSMGDNSKKYNEITDVREYALLNGDKIEKTYVHKEDFRFIIDFSECEENLLLKKGPYTLLLKFLDNNLETETYSTAINTIMVEESRKYEFEHEFDREWHERDSKVGVNITANSKYYVLFDEKEKEMNLVGVVSLKNKNGEYYKLSSNMDFYENGKYIEHTNGNVVITIMDSMIQESFSIKNHLLIDMTKLTAEEFLELGENTINIKYYIREDGIIKTFVAEYDITLDLLNLVSYTIKSSVVTENNMTEQALLKVNRSADSDRKIELVYEGELIKPYVEIIIEKENTNGFERIGNAITEKSIYPIETDKQEIYANFGSNVNNGRYKMLFYLYDQYGKLRATENIIFECQ